MSLSAEKTIGMNLNSGVSLSGNLPTRLAMLGRGNDLIDFITKRVQDAIEKSEFKRIGEKFSRNSITRAIAKIGREDENEAAAPAAGID